MHIRVTKPPELNEFRNQCRDNICTQQNLVHFALTRVKKLGTQRFEGDPVQERVKEQIERKIRESFNVDYVLVEDESWQHGGGAQAQSHFKIVAVCKSFEGMKLLARHRLVQDALTSIIAQVRAISLHTLTPDEWIRAQEENVSLRSPGCHNKHS